MRTAHKRLPLILAILSGLSLLFPPRESLCKLELMAVTGAGSLQSIDGRLSINDLGTVGFAGIDSDGLSKLFISASPGSRTPISLFGAGRLFQSAAINNGSPPLVATVERVSGSPPTFIVRKWATDNSTSFIVGNSGTSDIGILYALAVRYRESPAPRTSPASASVFHSA